MRAQLCLGAVCLSLCMGCDPMVHTHLIVTPAVVGASHQPDEVVALVRPLLLANGFGEFRATNEPPTSAVTFTDWYPGGNPHIWVAISHDGWPVTVDFNERWIAHRSRKHKKVVRQVEAKLKEHDFRTER
jgi:hypothetical protein